MIQHKHLFIRAETIHSPDALAGTELNDNVDSLIRDIGMKIVLPARCHYVTAEGNEGWTGQAGLETSHLTYHIWDNPDPKLLVAPKLKLWQMDVYTCGCMGRFEVVAVLSKLLHRFNPVVIEWSICDRSTRPPMATRRFADKGMFFTTYGKTGEEQQMRITDFNNYLQKIIREPKSYRGEI